MCPRAHRMRSSLSLRCCEHQTCTSAGARFRRLSLSRYFRERAWPLLLMGGALAALSPCSWDLMPRHLCGRSILSDGASPPAAPSLFGWHRICVCAILAVAGNFFWAAVHGRAQLPTSSGGERAAAAHARGCDGLRAAVRALTLPLASMPTSRRSNAPNTHTAPCSSRRPHLQHPRSPPARPRTAQPQLGRRPSLLDMRAPSSLRPTSRGASPRRPHTTAGAGSSTWGAGQALDSPGASATIGLDGTAPLELQCQGVSADSRSPLARPASASSGASPSRPAKGGVTCE